MKKKSLFALVLSLVFVCCAFICVGCGESPANFVVNKNAYTATDGIINSLFSKVYNKIEATASPNNIKTFDQIKENIEGLDQYYVQAGVLENMGEVNSINIGGVTINKDEEFNLSIGNNNFIKEKYFYVQDNKLFIAAPVLKFESLGNNKIKINNNEYDFKLTETPQNIEFTSVVAGKNSTSTIEKVDNQYVYTFKKGTDYITFNYEDANVEDIILTRKVINDKISYGISKAENINGVGLHLYLYYTTDAIPESLDNATLDYSAYIQNKGIANAKITIEVEQTTQAE